MNCVRCPQFWMRSFGSEVQNLQGVRGCRLGSKGVRTVIDQCNRIGVAFHANAMQINKLNPHTRRHQNQFLDPLWIFERVTRRKVPAEAVSHECHLLNLLHLAPVLERLNKVGLGLHESQIRYNRNLAYATTHDETRILPHVWCPPKTDPFSCGWTIWVAMSDPCQSSLFCEKADRRF